MVVDSILPDVNHVSCKNYCYRNVPRVIDEEYHLTMFFTFLKDPQKGDIYTLPSNNIFISGTFNSVWVWDKEYNNENMRGQINVIKYKPGQKMILLIEVYEHDSGDSAFKQKLINRQLTFR
jgi:hypothetical protein